jgi:hypothetical protein
MSKRTRGSARAHRRPGARPPISRAAGVRPARPSATTTAADRSPAAPLEVAPEIAEAGVDHRAEPAATRARPLAASAHVRPRAKPGSLLAARAANEYVYVAQDIRRIVVVAGLLFAAMIVAWLLLVVLKAIPLGLY